MRRENRPIVFHLDKILWDPPIFRCYFLLFVCIFTLFCHIIDIFQRAISIYVMLCTVLANIIWRQAFDIDIYIDTSDAIFEWQTWIYSTSHLLDVYWEFKVFIFEAFKFISFNKKIIQHAWHCDAFLLDDLPLHLETTSTLSYEGCFLLCSFIFSYPHIHLIIQAPWTHLFKLRKGTMWPRLPWHSLRVQWLVGFFIFLWLPVEITGM